MSESRAETHLRGIEGNYGRERRASELVLEREERSLTLVIIPRRVAIKAQNKVEALTAAR